MQLRLASDLPGVVPASLFGGQAFLHAGYVQSPQDRAGGGLLCPEIAHWSLELGSVFQCSPLLQFLFQLSRDIPQPWWVGIQTSARTPRTCPPRIQAPKVSLLVTTREGACGEQPPGFLAHTLVMALRSAEGRR